MLNVGTANAPLGLKGSKIESIILSTLKIICLFNKDLNRYLRLECNKTLSLFEALLL